MTTFEAAAVRRFPPSTEVSPLLRVSSHTEVSTDEEQVPSLNALPNEMLLKIFTYIPHKELCNSVIPVCRRWYYLGLNPLLWEFIVLKNVTRKNFKRQIIAVNNRLNRAARVKRLIVLSRQKNVSERILQTIFPHCAMLNSLRIVNFELSEPMMSTFANSCSKLKTIEALVKSEEHFMSLSSFENLTSIKIKYYGRYEGISNIVSVVKANKYLTELSITCLPLSCKTLKELFKHFNFRMTSLKLVLPDSDKKSISSLLGSCNQLKKLSLISEVKGQELDVWPLRNLNKLTFFELSGFDSTDLDRDLCKLFATRNFTQLEILSIVKFPSGSDELLKTIVVTTPRLRALYISRWLRISDHGFEILEQDLHIRTLFLKHIGDKFTGSCFVRIVPYMKYLTINNCEGVSLRMADKIERANPGLELSVIGAVHYSLEDIFQ